MKSQPLQKAKFLVREQCLLLNQRALINIRFRDFFGSPVSKKLPSNAEDAGLIPGQGRLRMPSGN